MIRRVWRRLVAYLPIWQCLCGELARRGRWCSRCEESFRRDLDALEEVP